jgi:hypothetical protein
MVYATLNRAADKIHVKAGSTPKSPIDAMSCMLGGCLGGEMITAMPIMSQKYAETCPSLTKVLGRSNRRG